MDKTESYQNVCHVCIHHTIILNEMYIVFMWGQLFITQKQDENIVRPNHVRRADKLLEFSESTLSWEGAYYIEQAYWE